MTALPIEILLVEDNPGDARFVSEMVREAPDLRLHHVDRLAAGIEHLNAHKVDVLLLDLGLPDSQGLDTLRAVLDAVSTVPVVVLTGHDDETLGRAAVREGAQDYLVKGRVVEHALTRAVHYAIERGEAQARLRHLNRVLRAIREVNQLIVREKDPARLIEEACDLLVETRGYRAVWIAQLGETGQPVLIAQSGWGDSFEPFAARLRCGEFPRCWEKAQDAGQEMVLLEPGQDCPECLLHGAYGQNQAAVAPLRHADELLGMLGVCLVTGASIDGDERSLLVEMAGDLGLALHGIKRDLAHRREEEQRRLAVDVLSALNQSSDVGTLVGDILRLVQQGTGIEAVAIRLRDGDDFPYFVTSGMPGGFVQAERSLCARDEAGRVIRDAEGRAILECMCGNVIRGRTDPSKPFFTAGGSFWTNGTTALLASTTAEDRQARTRNRCNGEGYESVALIPLRSRDEIIGLLQLNDHRVGMFTREGIEFLEGLGASIGIALGRQRATDALRESEARVHALFDASPDAVLVIGPDGRYVEANTVALTRYGYSRDELLAMAPSDLAALDLAGAAADREALARAGETQFEWRHRCKDGTEIPVDVVTRPLTLGGRPCVQSSVRDISERKRSEEQQQNLHAQLIHSQKLEAVGQLAGGVAHDFNNILQAMLSLSTVLRLKAGTTELASTAGEIDGLVRRGAGLTHQLLLFSRREAAAKKRMDLGELTASASVMLRRLIPENICLAVETTPGRVWLDGDAGQLQQVLMNLAVNARDAMPAGGTLTLRAFARDGSAVLEVADTGHGMDEEIRAHLFEPFFTTKGAGKGTGLGLSVVHGIVGQHGGRIEVESVPGEGTLFRVILPSAAAPDGPASTAKGEAEAPRGRGERVLVVEDEEGARRGLAELLTILGYQVVAAGSGEEAGTLPAAPAPDLLLTDLMLPGIDGATLAVGLRDRWPRMKVVLMSGYTEDEAVRRGVDEGAVRFLQKPFDMATLARAVSTALSGRGESQVT